VVESLLSGRVDYSNVLASPLLAAFGGQPLRCLAVYQSSGWELWAHPGVRNVAALAGRTVAAASPLVWAAAERALERAGVDPGALRIGKAVVLDACAVTEVLAGRVDAALLVSPVTIEAAAAGLQCLLRLDGRQVTPTYGVMTTTVRCERSWDEVVRVVRAVRASIAQLRSDRSLALALVGELGTSNELAPEVVNDALARFEPDGGLDDAAQQGCREIARKLPGFDARRGVSDVFDWSALAAARQSLCP
jgi:hypothetical protein